MAELLHLESLSLEDPSISVFERRNDIHIYISDELVFGALNYEYRHFTSRHVAGFRNSEHITFGNLFNALNAGLYFNVGLDSMALTPRGSRIGECLYIQWDVNNRDSINKRKYDVISVSQGRKAHLVRQQWGIKQISLRPRSKRATPATNSGLTSPREISGNGGCITGAQWSNDETTGDRYARAQRRAEKVPSPKQNRARVCFTTHCEPSAKISQASMASERCWEVHKECCITGTKGIAGSKPKDIVSMHIWQHAYQDEWLASGFENLCTDHGPDGQNRHEYTGWHHICCLNNMASVRSDLHELFNAFEIGIDFNDGSRIISFSEERTHLSEFRYNVDGIDPNDQPLKALWDEQFSQCVHYNCLHPKLLATSNDWSLEYDTSPSDDERLGERHLAHLTACDHIQDLENGPGKNAMEPEEYLRVALQVLKTDNIYSLT